jgi:hypothetical protein
MNRTVYEDVILLDMDTDTRVATILTESGDKRVIRLVEKVKILSSEGTSEPFYRTVKYYFKRVDSSTQIVEMVRKGLKVSQNEFEFKESTYRSKLPQLKEVIEKAMKEAEKVGDKDYSYNLMCDATYWVGPPYVIEYGPTISSVMNGSTEAEEKKPLGLISSIKRFFGLEESESNE